MKLLVCGGRDYADAEALDHVLELAFEHHGWTAARVILIEGGARGADRLARQWATANGVHCATVPALWASHGKAAGHQRNAAMLELLRPDYCIAFPGGAGTADMVRRCQAANVPVWSPL